jgi:nucleoside phosphorylase
MPELTSVDPEGPAPEPVGVLAALPIELGSLPSRAEAGMRRQGLELHALELAQREVLVTACGVGLAAAAHGAAVLAAEGVRTLLVVGTCGALRRGMPPGTLVHCSRAVQADLEVRAGRETEASPELLEAWQRVAGGQAGVFLSRDRMVRSPWARGRLLRAWPAAVSVDMETGAAFAVAERAGCRMAALRVVTDRAGWGARQTFAKNVEGMAGGPADAVEELLLELS